MFVCPGGVLISRVRSVPHFSETDTVRAPTSNISMPYGEHTVQDGRRGTLRPIVQPVSCSDILLPYEPSMSAIT